MYTWTDRRRERENSQMDRRTDGRRERSQTDRQTDGEKIHRWTDGQTDGKKIPRWTGRQTGYRQADRLTQTDINITYCCLPPSQPLLLSQGDTHVNTKNTTRIIKTLSHKHII